MIFLLKLFLKSASKSCLFPLGGAAIFSAFARSCSVICNSVSADRIVMAASRLLGATAACIVLVSFAAGHRKLYWNGCIMVAGGMICQRIFPFLALVIFLKKLFLKSASKSCLFSFWCRDPVLELQFLALLRVVPVCFASQCLQIAL